MPIRHALASFARAPLRCQALRFALAGLLSLPTLGQAHAQDGISIGASAPMSEYFAVLGEEIEAGGRAAIENGSATLTMFDDACEAEGGAKTADAMIAAGIDIAIGYPCIEAFDAAMPKLAEANIPLILLGVQSEAIAADRSKGNWPVLRLAPKASDEAEALATYIKRVWRDAHFAIIDDGTLYGRQLAEAVRFRLEEDNLRPVFTDTYRPQLENQIALVRRLQKAGATHVFMGGDAYDAAVIGADAATIGMDLTLAGGSAFVAPPTDGGLADGTVFAALPEWPAADRILSDPVSGRKVEAIGDGYLVPSRAAVEIALQGVAGGGSGVFFGDFLGRTFETSLGPVSFDGNGDLSRNLFEIFVIRNGEPVPATASGDTGSNQ